MSWPRERRITRRGFLGVVLAPMLLPAASLAHVVGQAPEVVALVTLSTQTMEVFRSGSLLHSWPVSTARAGKVTPVGEFTPQWLSRDHRSTLYDGAPMPFSIFFRGNYAIHGTTETHRLGHPVSAGCVRLHPDHAEILFELAREVGLARMRIVIRR